MSTHDSLPPAPSAGLIELSFFLTPEQEEEVYSDLYGTFDDAVNYRCRCDADKFQNTEEWDNLRRGCELWLQIFPDIQDGVFKGITKLGDNAQKFTLEESHLKTERIEKVRSIFNDKWMTFAFWESRLSAGPQTVRGFGDKRKQVADHLLNHRDLDAVLNLHGETPEHQRILVVLAVVDVCLAVGKAATAPRSGEYADDYIIDRQWVYLC